MVRVTTATARRRGSSHPDRRQAANVALSTARFDADLRGDGATNPRHHITKPRRKRARVAEGFVPQTRTRYEQLDRQVIRRACAKPTRPGPNRIRAPLKDAAPSVSPRPRHYGRRSTHAQRTGPSDGAGALAIDLFFDRMRRNNAQHLPSSLSRSTRPRPNRIAAARKVPTNIWLTIATCAGVVAHSSFR